MKKISIIILITIFLTLLLTLSANAVSEDSTTESEIKLPDEYGDMLGSLDDDIKELFPEEIFSDKIEDLGAGAEKMSSLKYILSAIADAIGLHLGEAVGLFASLCGLVLLRSLCHSYSDALSLTKHLSTFDAVFGFMIFLETFGVCYKSVSFAINYIETLNSLMSGMVPLMSATYAMGGNVSLAVVNSASFSLFLGVSENLIGRTIMPFFALCISLSLSSGISGFGSVISPISQRIKKLYTTFIAVITMLLSSLMGMQSLLASRADSLAMRGVKFVSGNLIPIVGGAVGESLGALSTSVEYIRGSLGVVASVGIVVIFLSSLVSLILTKSAIGLSSTFAKMLGCEGESSFLSELESLFGYIIAALALCSLMFIFALTIFIKCAAAVGG